MMFRLESSSLLILVGLTSCICIYLFTYLFPCEMLFRYITMQCKDCNCLSYSPCANGESYHCLWYYMIYYTSMKRMVLITFHVCGKCVLIVLPVRFEWLFLHHRCLTRIFCHDGWILPKRSRHFRAPSDFISPSWLCLGYYNFFSNSLN